MAPDVLARQFHCCPHRKRQLCCLRQMPHCMRALASTPWRGAFRHDKYSLKRVPLAVPESGLRASLLEAAQMCATIAAWLHGRGRCPCFCPSTLRAQECTDRRTLEPDARLIGAHVSMRVYTRCV